MKILISVALLAFAGLFQEADAEITSWTLPSGGDANISIAENAAANDPVGTIDATTNATIGHYTLVTTGVPFALATTGELTVASATLDFETTPSYTLIIQAVDNETATATATLTVLVTDANDAPMFSSSAFSTCADDGSAAGTTVYTLSATDQDSDDTLTYTITGGNNGSDFDVSTDKIVTANALAMSRIDSYDLVVQVNDSVATASATVTVSVSGSCSSSAKALVFSLLTILTALVVTLN